MTKILVVEDDKFLANAYRVKLARNGYEVQLASDGQEGLQTLSQFKPDLIILDLVMPVKDGFTVLQEIQDNPELNQIPIIVASNLGQSEDTQKALALGAKDYIIKSDLSMKDVIAKIESNLNPPT